jgi:hypothetical protein
VEGRVGALAVLMGLINAGTFLATVQNYRLLWISGKFGGGKTSLAFYMAGKTWLSRGYRLITNSRCVWADKFEDINFLDEFGHLKAVVVLDEGGLEFKASKQVEEIAAYARKMDCIYIIPSFWPPVKAAQVVTCQPVFGFASIGFPLTVYKWKVELGGFKDGGTFYWYNPSEIWGVYSSQDPGDIAEDIVEFLAKKAEEFRELHGRSGKRLSALGVSEADLIRDAASEFREAADALSVAQRESRRRRP